MLISETYLNATEGHSIGESGIYTAFTNDVGKLFRFSQKEYGRCVSSQYVDTPNGGKPKRIGWVFQGNDKYSDTHEAYLREVWVTLHDAPDTVVRTAHYHDMGAKR